MLANGCADTGSSNNLCLVQLADKFKAKVVSVPGRSYSYEDASGNQLTIVGDADVFIQLPSETVKRKLHMLVMTSWAHNTLIFWDLHPHRLGDYTCFLPHPRSRGD